MSNPIIFARGSSNRKPAFQLTTLLRKSAGGIEASKQLANTQAEPHLKSFIDKYKLLSELSIDCNIARVTMLSSTEVGFEFAKGVDLQSQLDLTLADGDLIKAQKILDRVFKLIDSFPKSTINPSSNTTYVEVFGKSFDNPTECISPACIDFNLDNLFDDGSKLTLVDYEWVYDFPVPVNFLKLRVLQSAFLETKNLFLKSMPTESVTSFATNFFLPTKLAKQYREICADVGMYLESNVHFLNYLQIPQTHDKTTINEQSMPAMEFISNAFPSTLDKLQRTLDKLQLDEEHIRKQDQIIQQLYAKVGELENTLSHRTIGRAELKARSIIAKIHGTPKP